jgi:two-component system, OmpR family, manganese sensing sensor histidine kinase
MWFIGLSAAVYVIPTALAMMLFYADLTRAIDGELNVFMASFGHAINVIHGKPELRDWIRTLETNPPHSLVAYQLFDKDGRLLEAHGEPGIPILFKNKKEVSSASLSLRSMWTPIKSNEQTLGYLQVQLPTKFRDEAVRELALITAIIAPVVLLGLGFSSYLVAEKATSSIIKTNNMLRRFVADASHELYTPLSIVQAANESIQRQFGPTGIETGDFEIAESAMDRMEKMLEDLMMLSTTEAPAKPALTEHINLDGLLEDVVAEFQPKFHQKKVTLSLTVDQGGAVRGDLLSLHRLFSNTIENALRYTDPEGHVEVRLTHESHLLKVSVKDSGIGIPVESLPYIFDRFYRVDASRSRHSGGSGLGLAIASAIAHAHSGTIEATSAFGKGSTFTISLPLAPPRG